jgi:hypothetical protein
MALSEPRSTVDALRSEVLAELPDARAAREHVRIARALDHMPRTRRALEEGEVSMSAIRVLVAIRDGSADAFERCEPQLVEAARIHSVSDLQRVAAFWREAARTGSELVGGCTGRSRCSGWCAWTAISIPRRVSRC